MSDSGRGKGRMLVGVGILAVLAAVGIERLIVTDEEAVAAVVERLITAMEDEDEAGVDALLLPEFEYRGPRPIGRGDREEALEALRSFWGRASAISYSHKGGEVRLAGPSAAHLSSGVVKFKWEDLTAIQRMTFEVTCVRRAEDWEVTAVTITDLRRGLF